MNLDKAKKRLIKKAKRGFQGYPKIDITYYGPNGLAATKVVVEFTGEENAEPQQETFNTSSDARDDIAVQSAINKIIDRADAKTVVLNEAIVIES